MGRFVPPALAVGGGRPWGAATWSRWAGRARRALAVGEARRAAARRPGQAGQATVELVGLLPVLVAVALGASQLLAAGIARELADHAAEAGAVAILQGADPEDAAREAVPRWARDGLDVTVDGDRVRVTLRPRLALPTLADDLSAHATAYAGEGDA